MRAEKKTYAEIGTVMGLTASRIHQIMSHGATRE